MKIFTGEQADFLRYYMEQKRRADEAAAWVKAHTNEALNIILSNGLEMSTGEKSTAHAIPIKASGVKRWVSATVTSVAGGVDWEAVCEHYGIPPEALNDFRKPNSIRRTLKWASAKQEAELNAQD